MDNVGGYIRDVFCFFEEEIDPEEAKSIAVNSIIVNSKQEPDFLDWYNEVTEGAAYADLFVGTDWEKVPEKYDRSNGIESAVQAWIEDIEKYLNGDKSVEIE